MIELVAGDFEENSSDYEIMKGDFVVVSINVANGIHQRSIARNNIVNGDEPERVFMQKIKGHRLEEEKLAFVFDSKDKTPKHKEDVLR